MILCVDTSTAHLMVSLVEESPIPNSRKVVEFCSQKGRSQILFHLLPPLENVTKIVVGMGPGSFTGLRVGITFAKILSLSARLPLAGVPSLKSFKNSQGLVVYARSRAQELYGYDPRADRLEVVAEENRKENFIGPLLQEETDCELKYERELYLPDPLTMVELGNFSMEACEIRPIYMRPSYAEEKRQQKKRELS